MEDNYGYADTGTSGPIYKTNITIAKWDAPKPTPPVETPAETPGNFWCANCNKLVNAESNGYYHTKHKLEILHGIDIFICSTCKGPALLKDFCSDSYKASRVLRHITILNRQKNESEALAASYKKQLPANCETEYLNPQDNSIHTSGVTQMGSVPIQGGKVRLPVHILSNGEQVYPINRMGMLHLAAQRDLTEKVVEEIKKSVPADYQLHLASLKERHKTEIAQLEQTVTQHQERIATLLAQIHQAGITPAGTNDRRVQRSLDV